MGIYSQGETDMIWSKENRGIVLFSLIWLMLLMPTLCWAVSINNRTVKAQSAPAPIPWSELGTQASMQSQGRGVSLRATASGAYLETKFQRLAGKVREDGLWIWSTSEKVGASSLFSVRARSLGRQGNTYRKLRPCGRVEKEKKRIHFRRPGLVEEYTVSVDGIQQDFVIAERPSGQGDLRLVLSVRGARAEKSNRALILTPHGSQRRLAYHSLCVTDAENRKLEARIEVESAERLVVIVADAGATYPICIDPTFSDANWVNMGLA